MILEPSLFTVITWPRYGRQYQYAALGFVCILLCALMGAKIIHTKPIIGTALLTLAILAHLMTGAIIFSCEIYAESINRKADD